MRHSATKDQDRLVQLLDELRATVCDSRVRLRAACDDIESLAASYMRPDAPIDWHPYRLTRAEARVAEYLYVKLGKTVPHEQVMDVLYHDRLDDIPDNKILDTLRRNLRIKLSGSPFRIVTIYRVGVRMERAASTLNMSVAIMESFYSLVVMI
jgi:DNA-binding response OmpR family regulator